MRQRVISAVIALILVIPILIIGGFAFSLGVYIISLLALKEFMKVRREEHEMPAFIKFISYILLTILLFKGSFISSEFVIDFRILLGSFLMYLIPTIAYKKENYNIKEAFYMLGMLFFIGISFTLLIMARESNIHVLVYLLTITVATDTFAYIAGSKIGKYKLLPSISPNKTIEGMLFGTIFGTVYGTIFYMTIIDPNQTLTGIIFLSLVLSLMGQFGDLVFSGVKRCFGKKDFSNIMPGHGGILDRLDSIIFVLMTYYFIITLF